MYDVGQDFDVTSGVFVAPHNGVYVFSYQIFPKFMGSFVVDLYKNGRVATRMHVTDMKVGPSDATAVAEHARAGDRYWIQASKGGELHGGPYSFFSATLVADED
ncbi:hypothetical protein BaRGS_00021385 [Batillaria attramentaria]|uniref:C1q domain-containing protein n=1 Tax=Batillaria attramentaria TaxID=370345 RepID=A0ABD0KJY1_9CAEN